MLVPIIDVNSSFSVKCCAPCVDSCTPGSLVISNSGALGNRRQPALFTRKLEMTKSEIFEARFQIRTQVITQRLFALYRLRQLSQQRTFVTSTLFCVVLWICTRGHHTMAATRTRFRLSKVDLLTNQPHRSFVALHLGAVDAFLGLVAACGDEKCVCLS